MRAQLWFVTMVSLAAACRGGQDSGTPEQTAPQAAAPATSNLPDTTAAALWAYLRQVDYSQNWRLWPGKDRLYKGTEPHGMLLTTYVNDLALDALTNGAQNMPPGALIVKENYMPDSTLAAITTMYRVQGYDAQHQDWFFAKHDPQGKVEVAGRVQMCQSCHQTAAGGGYLFSTRPR
ncbi:MAG: cytochrome P460 family protein [Longimicrobiales bacterium]